LLNKCHISFERCFRFNLCYTDCLYCNDCWIAFWCSACGSSYYSLLC